MDQYIVLQRLLPHQDALVAFGLSQGKVIVAAKGKDLHRLWPGTVFEAAFEHGKRQARLYLTEISPQFMLYGRCWRLFQWQQKFLHFCAQIFALEQQCVASFDLLLNFLRFPWQDVPANFLNLILQTVLLELLNFHGYTNAQYMGNHAAIGLVETQALFTANGQPSLTAKPLNRISTLQQRTLLVSQVEQGLGKKNLTLFLELLEGLNEQSSLENKRH